VAATNSVLVNDTAITLDWADVSGANLYRLQVSTTVDFSGTLMVDDATLLVSTKAFTDTGTTSGKRYWRWRSSTDAGTTWSEWSVVGSYWLDTTFSGDVTLSNGTWALVNPADVTDKYVLPDYPYHRVVGQQIYRGRTRNRAGQLLTEWLTNKDAVTLDFPDGNFVTREHLSAWKRFHVQVKTFFLVASVYDGAQYVPKVWKGILSTDPAFTMLAAGREDHFVGTIEFEEA
jgi:hypothetical protein